MNAPLSAHSLPPYKHTPLFPLGKDNTPYRKISAEGLRVERVLGEEVLVVPREALRALAEAPRALGESQAHRRGSGSVG
jgi:fumarate hydratase, class I